MKQQLEQLASCGRPWAEQRAQFALEITGSLERGEISESEYKELMIDLIASDQFMAEADDMEIKNMLVAAVMIGAKIA